MCGRVVQVSDPIRLSIVDGLGVRETRPSNYPRRWNAAPSQELLVIRENHNTGERSLDLLKWGLIPLSLPKTPSAWVAALTESEHDPGR